MKKTLIALAALAATGASFAQVTISGTVASGFSQATSNTYSGIQTRDATAVAIISALNGGGAAGAAASAARSTVQNSASGFGVDTADIVLTAKEDLGSGQTVEAKLGLENVARGGAGTGAFGANDLTLTYTNTSFGRIQMGATKGSAVHSGIPSAGAPVVDMDGKLFETRSSSDYINYAAPIGPVVVILNLGEASNASNVPNGLGAGQSGDPSVVKQRSTSIAGYYKDGPIEALAGYKVLDNTTDQSISGPAKLTKDSQWQIQGGYDFGVAKVGFGYAFSKATVGATVADMLVGINVPMGALEIGATWAQEIVSGIRDVNAASLGGAAAKAILQEADGTAQGWSIGAKYNLSKRTNVKLNYASWTRSGCEQFESFGGAGAGLTGGAALNAGAKFMGYGPTENQTNLLLTHSF